MHSERVATGQLVAIRLDPGEDVLLSIQAAVQEHGINSAVLISGVGSLTWADYPARPTDPAMFFHDPGSVPGNSTRCGDHGQNVAEQDPTTTVCP